MQEKVRMILPAKVFHNVLQQCTIFLTALVLSLIHILMYQSEYPASSINILSSETLEPNVVSKSPTMAELIPVSYTHLDVYKRQDNNKVLVF